MNNDRQSLSRTKRRRPLEQLSGHLSRRGFLSKVGIASTGLALPPLLGGCAIGAQTAEHCNGIPPTTRQLRAAFTNNSLTHTWCAQGKRVAETWGKWLGVDVVWYDGK